MQKCIYIQNGTPLDEFLIILEKRELTLSNWVNDKIVQEVKAERLKKEPVKVVRRCNHPRIKIANKNCGVEVCPLLDRTYGKTAQERQFIKVEEFCVFRVKTNDALASTQK